MRVAMLLLLLCVPLAACNVTGENPPPKVATPPAAPTAAAPAPSVPASPPPPRSAGSGGARGGSATAAARGDPVEAPPDSLLQARASCWAKVESQKGLRNIDQRSAFVDKCVADEMKGKPSP